MGSDSDWKVMEDATAALDEFGIAYEVDVVSAHRMPENTVEYGRKASERGLRVVTADVEDTVHLPGMPTALTSLSIVGAPVPLRRLSGMDSLLLIVQMPAGTPVAVVSIAGARSAGLLTARTVGSAPTGRDARDRMAAFRDGLGEMTKAKGAALRGRLGG